jgi:hypothetical protein
MIPRVRPRIPCTTDKSRQLDPSSSCAAAQACVLGPAAAIAGALGPVGMLSARYSEPSTAAPLGNRGAELPPVPALTVGPPEPKLKLKLKLNPNPPEMYPRPPRHSIPMHPRLPSHQSNPVGSVRFTGSFAT